MPKLYIEVLGGVVCGVYSNAATEVILIDHDNVQDMMCEPDGTITLLKEFEADKNSPGFTELGIN